jgi:deazaflavin-dependent oxidoreductase (nitroreductase family)
MLVLVLFAIIALAFVALVVVRRIGQARAFRAGDVSAIDAKREANLRWRNAFIGRVMKPGARYSPFSLLTHRGRTSGRAFTAVVRAVPDGDGFIVPTPYGARTQWLKNLTASPGELRWHGHTVAVADPLPADATSARRRYPAISRFLFWLDGTSEFVRLSRARSTITDPRAARGRA